MCLFGAPWNASASNSYCEQRPGPMQTLSFIDWIWMSSRFTLRCHAIMNIAFRLVRLVVYVNFPYVG